jgi:hypothetical protein
MRPTGISDLHQRRCRVRQSGRSPRRKSMAILLRQLKRLTSKRRMVKVAAVADHMAQCPTSPTPTRPTQGRQSPCGPNDPGFSPTRWQARGKRRRSRVSCHRTPPVRLQPALSVPANWRRPRANVARPVTHSPPWASQSTKRLQRVGGSPFLLLPSGLDFHDRLLHCLIHGAANLMVGLRHAFRIEVAADHAEHAVTIGMIEIGRDDIGGV